MAYVDLNTIHNPAPGTVAPAAWADQVRDNFEALPRGILGLAESTSNKGPTSGTTELDILSIAVTVGSSRRIRISFQAVETSGTTVEDRFYLRLKEGATQLLQAQSATVASNATYWVPWVTLAPSAGAHTYKATIQRVGGTGIQTLVASATSPIQLLVEDIGPA